MATIKITRLGTDTTDEVEIKDFLEAIKRTGKPGSTIVINGIQYDANSVQFKDARVKTFRAFLSQTGTNPPVAAVLENSIGDIVFSRQVPGNYKAALPDAFPANKTFILGQPSGATIVANRNGVNEILFTTSPTPTDPPSDNLMSEWSFLVEVHP